jgi:hypothetical protein
MLEASKETRMELPVLHITRGSRNPKTLDQARTMHNAFVTKGPQPGIEIARSLGDLSHTLYAPAENAGSLSGAKPGELLFIDYWADPSGMEQFFSNPFAQQAGDRLFSSREESEWMPAPAAFTFQVPAPAGMPARFVRMLRAPVRSAEEATAVLGKLVWANLGAARRRGQLSHSLFVRLAGVIAARPASNARRSAGENLPTPPEPVEILTIESWSTLEGLNEHHGDTTATSGLDDALAGPPAASVWEQVSGFSEW